MKKSKATANSEIRTAAGLAGVKMWQIADQLGIHDTNFSKMLRHELPAEEKARILTIIAVLSAGV